MKPILKPGDKVKLLEKQNIERYDIVVIDTPVIGIEYAFRVIGLPGEWIQFKENSVFINGKQIRLPNEISYSQNLPQNAFVGIEKKFLIKPDRYFVIGDNMEKSRDSRVFGPIPKDAILGFVR